MPANLTQDSRHACSPLHKNAIVEQGLDLRLCAQNAKKNLQWGCVNFLLMILLLYDVLKLCPYARKTWKWYAEYALLVFFAWHALTRFASLLWYMCTKSSVEGSRAQQKLLSFDKADASFVVKQQQCAEKRQDNFEDNLIQTLNTTLLSCQSSFNDSRNQSAGNWSYSRKTPPPRQSFSPQKQYNSSRNSSMLLNNTTLSNSNSSTPFQSPYLRCKDQDLIADRRSLQQYLKNVSWREEQLQEPNDTSQTLNNRTVGGFWNYCNTATTLLKTTLYQLAPLTAPTTPNKRENTDECGLNIIDSNSEVIKRISSEKLSQYVANLRTWMSSTILARLSKEIENIDESFKNRGFVDMQMGSIGLERLKKTVENQQFINQYMPRLPLIVPFLEMSSNQEYLVQRIKDLAKGFCIADYRWNSGSAYHGLKWDEHLPTDSAILFHLFCVYLDTQLMPLPQGGGRPFFSRYVIMGEEKRSAKDTIAAVQNRAHCAILCTDPLKPKFNFISDKEIHACTYDRNNLFYVIIQFLIYMKTHHESCLEGVNLGRSGINIMCVIEQD